jgi:hypothetical protein
MTKPTIGKVSIRFFDAHGSDHGSSWTVPITHRKSKSSLKGRLSLSALKAVVSSKDSQRPPRKLRLKSPANDRLTARRRQLSHKSQRLQISLSRGP